MHTQISNFCFCSRFEWIAWVFIYWQFCCRPSCETMRRIQNNNSRQIMRPSCDAIVQCDFWFCRESIVSIQTKCSAQMENDRRWRIILPICRRREPEKYFSVIWPAKIVHHMTRCCVYKLPNFMHDAVPTPNCSRAFQRPWNNWNTSSQRKENDLRFSTAQRYYLSMQRITYKRFKCT